MKRICDHCGKPITFGCMTNDYGDFYVHEECFEDWKGKDKWKDVYYTKYEREDLEDEE